MASTIWVQKQALTQTHVHEAPMPMLSEGAVRLRIESFSVTANNITYAVIGDVFGYWNFFPAEGDFGVVPMWGHAIVEESRHPDIAVGERVYGYLPMGAHLDVLPGKISQSGFTDMAAHRQPARAQPRPWRADSHRRWRRLCAAFSPCAVSASWPRGLPS